MVSKMDIQNLFMGLETFERGLNVVGYIPYIRTVGASVRTCYAAIESIAGIAFALLAAGAYVQGKQSRSYLLIGGTLFGHAILNQIRAAVEEHEATTLLTTLPYDLVTTYYFGKRYFSYI